PASLPAPQTQRVPATMSGASTEGSKIAFKMDVTAVDGVKLDVSVLSAAEAPLFNARGKEGEPLTLRNVGVRATDNVVFVVVKSAWSGAGKDARRAWNANKAYALTVAQAEAAATA